MATTPHTIQLLNIPAGFDVFKVSQQDVEMIWTPETILVEGEKIRLKRQEGFEGSAELHYVIDGERQAPEETGLADIREDEVVNAPGGVKGWRLQTNCECKPKS